MHQPSPQSASGMSSRARSKARRLAAILVMIQAACWVPQAMADASLTYSLSGTDDDKAVKHFSVARFFARIEDPADSDNYLVFQAGRFFPLFSVDTSKETWTRLTPPETHLMGPQPPAKEADAKDAGESGMHHEEAHPSASDNTASEMPASQARKRPAQPLFKATKKRVKVAGIDCRIVYELVDNEPVIEHCMANTAALGINEREIITLSRMFRMARHRDFGWLATGTQDDEFVSIRSRDLGNDRVMELTGVDTTPLPAGHLRIPKHYKEVEPKTPAAD